MNTDTHLFYEQLKGFTEFSDFASTDWYRPLPGDWLIVITDVRGSTRAIEQGKYKQVNGVGVASMVALLNAVKPLKIPYVFGGDGASACLPSSAGSLITSALVAARKMSREQFGLELRVGVVPMQVIREQGGEVLVGKFEPHPYYQQAMFLGNGLGYAETLVKDPSADNPYLITQASHPQGDYFRGFECRWNNIPSPHEENIALLVQACPNDSSMKNAIYSRVLEHIRSIYGEDAECHPLRENRLSLAASPALLRIEAGIRTAFQSKWNLFKYLFRLELLRLAGIWVMSRGTRTQDTNWGDYKHHLIINTDYRKFDEILRMVISGTASQRQELRHVLEIYQERGDLNFGMHAAKTSLITCIVTDYDRDHVHFLDVADGGYAVAARELKQQLAKRRVASGG